MARLSTRPTSSPLPQLLLASLPLLLLLLVLPAPVRSQYENYNFLNFPGAELGSLDAAYALALRQYEAEQWGACLSSLERALRLHRFVRDSLAFCRRNCSRATPGQGPQSLPMELGLGARPGSPPQGGAVEGEMRALGVVFRRAQCLKRCREMLPAFRAAQPSPQMLADFDRRAPYQYLQIAYYKTDNLPAAMAAAYTFLQRNPEDEMAQKNLHFFWTQPGASEKHLRDLEADPFQTLYREAVRAYGTGDHLACVEKMERALAGYLHAFHDCASACEGGREVTTFQDFYASMADHYSQALACKVSCEARLVPLSGGEPQAKFVATMYHYLQFCYYKLGEFKQAVRALESYSLFDPEDEVIKQNLVYHKVNKDAEGLTTADFEPRPEALEYRDLTVRLWEMYNFSVEFLAPDDEMELDGDVTYEPELDTSDVEFEGEGDYEESIYSDWWQEPQHKGDVGVPSS
ncbi:endoplasmic reticulum protein SC65 [Lethenteron reissneri]|uniref:endoplasmic reticulum protein SC65 n=1 Tax=Lethenteron reissneri TaxID=7753 RepID=UPI002AB6B354|nr:endoplasmic reticulum protein SC65 [Lethenteron reissneri]